MKKSAIVVVFALSAWAQNNPAPATAPDTNAKQARVLLDRTVQALGGKAFLTYFDVRQAEASASATMSRGVSAFPTHGFINIQTKSCI